MKLVALSAILMLAIASCQPDLSDNPLRPKQYTSLQDFYSQNKAVPLQVTANSAAPIAIQGAKGSRFFIPANAFATRNNEPVIGDVAIEVKEILTPSDMILNNMPTMSDRKPLESGGQFFIRATKNGEELKLMPGKQVQVSVPNSANMAGMQVFNGTLTSNGLVNWQLNTNPGNIIRADSLGGSFYTLFADDINWLNIDKFVIDERIRYTINPGNCPDFEQTTLYVHIKGRNTVVIVPKLDNRFLSEYLIAAPATIVAICVKERQLYASISEVNLQNGGAATLQFSATTDIDLKERLKTLR